MADVFLAAQGPCLELEDVPELYGPIGRGGFWTYFRRSFETGVAFFLRPFLTSVPREFAATAHS